jgi:glycosyltransferase involved in cell wall biosynthesis
MIIGIDASNLRAGGGLTHLVEFLKVAEPNRFGIEQIIVWGGSETLKKIDEQPWLKKEHDLQLDKSVLFRIYWQKFYLSKYAKTLKCDILFVPGGSYAGSFHPVVTMSRNMLPFEWNELKRYGWSYTGIRLLLLRFTQAKTFTNVDGLIFLTNYAKVIVSKVCKKISKKMNIIPHGIDERFFKEPDSLKIKRNISEDNPFHIIYVSIIDVYKHQWQVAKAVSNLRKEGIPIVVELIGPSYKPSFKRLQAVLKQVDPVGKYIRYKGSVPHKDLHSLYKNADLCLFASSCENLPNILLEGMASGLPVVCSNKGPMLEVLGDAGLYFDPENPEGIAAAIKQMYGNKELRYEMARKSFERARCYSWIRCADETLAFISSIKNKNLV